MKSALFKDGLRFLFAGLMNAGVTFLVYQLLLFWTGEKVAYALSWIVGLLIVVLVYPSKVFVGGRKDLTVRLALGVSYLLVFLIGLGLLDLLTTTGVSPRVSIILVMAVTTATNFLFGRTLVRRS